MQEITEGDKVRDTANESVMEILEINDDIVRYEVGQSGTLRTGVHKRDRDEFERWREANVIEPVAEV